VLDDLLRPEEVAVRLLVAGIGRNLPASLLRLPELVRSLLRNGPPVEPLDAGV